MDSEHIVQLRTLLGMTVMVKLIANLRLARDGALGFPQGLKPLRIFAWRVCGLNARTFHNSA